MSRVGYDTNVVDLAVSATKAVGAFLVLVAAAYLLHDVYAHTGAIHTECQNKVDLEIVQARDLLAHFCVLHPNDEGGHCQKAQWKVSVRDRGHAVRDCRIDHLTDMPIIKEVFTLSVKGVFLLVVALVVLVCIVRLVAATMSELMRVTSAYKASMEVGLPTVVQQPVPKVKSL